MSHIDNIPHIAKCGFVHRLSPLASPNYVVIGDTKVIEKRSKIINGSPLNDYIPFYFGPRSPMLYVIQKGYNGVKRVDAEQIVYCVISLQEIIDQQVDCIFTDGHALDALSTFYPSTELIHVNEIIRYNDVYAHFWNIEDDQDLKRRKEAELLVKQDLDPIFIKGYIVYNEKAKHQLIQIGIDETKVVVCPTYYF